MAKVFKRGKYYYYRLSVNGRDTWKSTEQTTKDEAQDVANAHADAHKGKGTVEDFFQALMQKITALPETERPEMRQRLARRLLALEQRTLKITEAWQAWLDTPQKGNPCARTIADYECAWKQFETWAAGRKLEYMHEVMPSDAEEYSANLWKNNITARTYNSRIVFLKGVFAVLKNRASILSNPWTEIKKLEKETKGRVNFTPQELAVVCRKATGAMRYMIAVGLYTGLRLGDVVNLKWATVHPGKIEVMPRKTARKGKTITIPLHPVLAALLEERRAQVSSEFVFPDEVALYAREPAAVSKRFQSFLEGCGIVTCEAKGEHRQRAIVRKGFHSLRHSFVSLCAANRVPQVAIQDLVGHGSPAMTALYSHADFDQKQAAIATLPTMAFNHGPDAK